MVAWVGLCDDDVFFGFEFFGFSGTVSDDGFEGVEVGFGELDAPSGVGEFLGVLAVHETDFA